MAENPQERDSNAGSYKVENRSYGRVFSTNFTTVEYGIRITGPAVDMIPRGTQVVVRSTIPRTTKDTPPTEPDACTERLTERKGSFPGDDEELFALNY
jgi:hypothetical protein